MTEPNASATGRRNYRMDNLRAALLFLVVYGHFSELFPGRYQDMIYVVIYTFHMPFFLFITGYFARYNPKKLLRHLVLPYAVFQILFHIFDPLFLGNEPFVIQFTTPYWILWYLLVVIFGYLLLPLFEKVERKQAPWVLGLLALLALAAGYDETLGYYMSLSRAVVFLPFFFAGHFFAKLKLQLPDGSRGWKLFGVCLVLMVAGEILYRHLQVPNALLFGAKSYALGGGNPLVRILAGALACLWIVLGLIGMPDREIPLVTTLGQNTLPVFLFHGFFQRLMEKYGFFHYSGRVNFLLAIGMTLVMLLVFGNRWVGKVFRRLF